MCEFDQATAAKRSKGQELLDGIAASNYVSTYEPVLSDSVEPRDAIVPSKHGEAQRVAVFQNTLAAEALKSWSDGGLQTPLAMPDGSILVKHNLTADDKLESVTVMVKDMTLDEKDYPSHWFWIKATPELQVIVNCEARPAAAIAGNVQGCIGCHNGETNSGVFPDPNDSEAGGKLDALVNYHMIVSAFCDDPKNTECGP